MTAWQAGFLDYWILNPTAALSWIAVLCVIPTYFLLRGKN